MRATIGSPTPWVDSNKDQNGFFNGYTNPFWLFHADLPGIEKTSI
jgi:hypothetical protein